MLEGRPIVIYYFYVYIIVKILIVKILEFYWILCRFILHVV